MMEPVEPVEPVEPGRLVMQRLVLCLVAVGGLALLGACANLGVQAWERDIHARSDMAVSEQPLTDALEDHTFFSKEAASGGRSFGGGGCGCN